MSDGFVDLHAHTNFSDGRLTPEELVDEAVWRGLSAVALTDHDNVDGLPRFQAACAQKKLEAIHGVELSCEVGEREAHIVGLFIEPCRELTDRLEVIRDERENRMGAMLERLNQMGIPITLDEIPQASGKSFGRPHLAQAMVKRGIVKDIGEAFAKYIGDNGPAYVAKTRFQVAEAIRLLKQSNATVILAHPGVNDLIDEIPWFVEQGVEGVEVYYPSHSPQMTDRIRDYISQFGLLESGGTDYHGNGHGPALGALRVPYPVLERMKLRRSA